MIVAICLVAVMVWKYNKTERLLMERIETMEKVLDIANVEFEQSIKDKRTTRQNKLKMFYNGRASAYAEMLIAIRNYKEEAKDEEV